MTTSSSGHKRSKRKPAVSRAVVCIAAAASLAAIVAAAAPPTAPRASEPATVEAGKPAYAADTSKVYEKQVKPFLQAHCVTCHGAKKALAGFRVDTLGTDFLEGKTADQWKEIYDRVGAGRMPPAEKPQPNAREIAAITDWIFRELGAAQKRGKNASGRIPMRRLNRTEYANTLRDLFFLDENFARIIEHNLPADGKLDGFDRAGASLFVDEAQMARYLETADFVLNREVFRPKPTVVNKKYLARDIHWRNPKYKDAFIDLVPAHPQTGKKMTERKKVALGADYARLKNGGLEYLAAPSEPYRLGQLWLQTGSWFGGSDDPIAAGKFQEGWYRVKIRAGAFKGTGAHAVPNVQIRFSYLAGNPDFGAKTSIVVDAPLDKPRDFEAQLYLRPAPAGQQKSFRLDWNGMTNIVLPNPILAQLNKEFYDRTKRVTKDSSKAEIAEAVKRREAFDKRYHDTVMNKLKVAYVYNPDIDLETIPRLWIESFSVEGPIVTWPPKGRKELLFAGEDRLDKKHIEAIFARFLPRAYRRPVKPEEVDEVVSWVIEMQHDTQHRHRLTGTEAVREGVRAVLCSPDFLLLKEPTGAADKPRSLNDYELASRLSYFLWSTMPDEELFKLAAANKLHTPDVLRAQVRRMIADPKGAALVHNFVGQWLKVREFDNVMRPERRQYKSYDNALRDASWQEPYEFFKEVLVKDLSILNFVDSDFLVINERLAQHYGIEGVKGEAFRRVGIRPEHHRGGVLGMAGVLTYLADGIRTLPVRRASYVLDAFWNSPPPPPPPDAGDLPPVRGRLTVRQRLEAHRKRESCASCHVYIDAFGMALENYDAIGAWRERQNGEGRSGDIKSPPIDVRGALPDKSKKESQWRKFKDLQGYKKALLAEKERFVRSFIAKMLTYALGRSVGAADRELIDGIVQTLEPKDAKEQDRYRLQTLIQAIVACDAFQTK